MLVLQLLFIVGFIYGIRLMGSPPQTGGGGQSDWRLFNAGGNFAHSNRRGNPNGAPPVVGRAGARFRRGGVWLARRVLMIQMPQMVALLNGLGGGASALVALVVAAHTPALTPFSRFATGLAVIVGGITLSGSLVAAAKLHGRLPPQRPFHLRLHNLYLWGTGAAVLAAWAASSLAFGPPPACGLGFGRGIFGLRGGPVYNQGWGGADMPITISLLNSLSGGVAGGAVAGFPPWLICFWWR